MNRMRAIARLAAMAVITALLYPLFVVFRSRRPRIVRRWHAAMARILGVRIARSGEVPRGAFLLVSNHLSYVDVVVLGGAIETVFVAKSDVRHWPFLGALSSSTGTIFIDRESRRDAVRVADAIAASISRERAVVVFPEGTSTDGTSVLPFKSPLLDAAARDTLPLYVAALRYAPAEVAWVGEAPFLPHVWRVLQLPRIDATLRLAGPIASSDRKELARQAREEIVALLGIDHMSL